MWYVPRKRKHLFWCQNGPVVRRKYCLLAEWLMVRKPPAAQRMLKQVHMQKPILLGSIAGGIHQLQCQKLLFASASCWGLCVFVSPSVKQIFMWCSSQKYFWDSRGGNVFSLLYCLSMAMQKECLSSADGHLCAVPTCPFKQRLNVKHQLTYIQCKHRHRLIKTIAALWIYI